MSDSYFNVELTGEFLNGQAPETAKASFAKLFKMPATQVEKVFSNTPFTIKRSVDAITAKKYGVALQKANIGVRITPVSQKAPTESPAPQAPATQASTRIFENAGGLPFSLQGQPDYAFLTVMLKEGQTVKVEASSMATMDTHIKMKTRAKGGIGRLFTGENLFINEFTAEHAPGEIGIAPGIPGDVLHRQLEADETLYLQNSAYLASTPDLIIETKLDIFKGIFSGAGLVLIKCTGPGDLWFNTYGAAIEVTVDGEYVVDTDKIVAWESSLEYQVSKVGGYKSLFFSGEGFVCRFKGHGKLWVQTRSANAFKSWAHWFRPTGKA